MLPTSVPQNDLAVDLNSLNQLRSQSLRDKRGALDQAAKQFEALFINMLLKSARKAGFGDPLFGSNQMDTYKGMFDQQLALAMSQSDTTGIGKMLVNQLQGDLGPAKDHKSVNSSSSPVAGTKANTPIRRYLGPLEQVRMPNRAAGQASAKGTDQANAVDTAAGVAFTSPSDFIEKLKPHAEAAAKELGVNPEVLLAQAALETGWGKHISRDSQGKSSFNLFNIKANSDWGGKSLDKQTLEFVSGGFVKQNASFRAYDGFEQSFADYVDFLKSNPRYGDAIKQAKSDIGFAKALQGAGYATDPAYAGKIKQVLHSPAMTEAFGNLKFGPNGPLNRRDG